MAEWSTKINVRSVSANPIIKLINFFIGIIEFFTGVIKSGELVEETDYLVINSKRKFLWFFTSSQDSLTIAKARISGVKVSTVRRMLIFSANTCEIYASGVSGQVAYAVKCSYKEIKDRADTWVK